MMSMVCIAIAAAVAVSVLTWAILLALAFRSDSSLILRFAKKYGKKPATLKGQVCWITGASRGVGEHIAYEFASHGLKLVLSGRNADRLEEVKKKCIVSGPIKEEDVLVLPFNIEDESLHSECVQKVLEKFGQIDIFVNNVAHYPKKPFIEGDLALDKETFNTDVFGPISLSRAVLKHMLPRRKGKIIVTTSVLAKMGSPGFSTPAACNHALHGYFETLRTEVAAKGIQVCMVCPGPVYMPKHADVEKPDKTPEAIEQEKKRSRRFVKPGRFAQLLAVAAANNLTEVWISAQPLLAMYYVAQFTPSVWRWFISRKIVQTFAKSTNKVR